MEVILLPIFNFYLKKRWGFTSILKQVQERENFRSLEHLQVQAFAAIDMVNKQLLLIG